MEQGTLQPDRHVVAAQHGRVRVWVARLTVFEEFLSRRGKKDTRMIRVSFFINEYDFTYTNHIILYFILYSGSGASDCPELAW